MGIAEFRAAVASNARRMRAAARAAVALSLALIAALVFAVPAWRDELAASGVPAGLPVVVASWLPAGGLMLVLWRYQATARDPRLTCPHCGRALQSASGIVVASRNCPGCGGRVLAEPDAEPGAAADGRGRTGLS